MLERDSRQTVAYRHLCAYRQTCKGLLSKCRHWRKAGEHDALELKDCPAGQVGRLIDCCKLRASSADSSGSPSWVCSNPSHDRNACSWGVHLLSCVITQCCTLQTSASAVLSSAGKANRCATASSQTGHNSYAEPCRQGCVAGLHSPRHRFRGQANSTVKLALDIEVWFGPSRKSAMMKHGKEQRAASCVADRAVLAV